MSPRKAAALRGAADDRTLRDHLVTTAQRLLADQGAATLTVRGIARAAGVADGVLYNHFPDKDALLAAAVRAHVDAAHRALGPLPAPGAATVERNLRAYLSAGLALHRAVLPVVAGLLATPAVLTRFTELPTDQPDWRILLARYLNGERELGRIAPDADTAAAAAVLVGICHDQVLATLLPGMSPHPVDADAVITTVLTGIAPRTERA
ncbi:TetR/AcrR family transcriptional regulator [Nocardia aurantiaca]|uniref:TetR family transcriptional regulator n=1 Tax=Nocardia aurantiaca TaxID=2675850 RepID=A0A6I3KZJ5_9NOCA|nr:TetR/AcrR family transcriptional regulator [Nocardia aurantiaca]MTE13845.1 TetR family transcriptional regulator [Nocardia aurantiaca]